MPARTRKSAQTLQSMWLTYRSALPPTLPAAEVRKAELAFHAGFAHAIEVMEPRSNGSIGS